jgi:hypothetical protein
MSVDVSSEVLIARPRAEVAAFMFEPRNDALWTTGVVDCKPLTEGLLQTGSRVERTSKFLGRRFSYLVEVTDYAPNTFVEMRVAEPFPMHIRYELEDQDGGTRARIRTRGEATGFFRVAAPLLGRMVRRSITNDLENLKEYLEGRADAR